MNKILLSVFFIINETTILLSQDSKSVFFPLEVGNVWEYGGNTKDKMYVKNDSIASKTRVYIHIEEMIDDGIIVTRFLIKKKEGIYQCENINDHKNCKLFVPFEPKLGDTLYMDDDDIYTVTDLKATLKTPNEIYNEVLEIRGKVNGYAYYFKRGIGIIGKVDTENKLIHYLKKYKLTNINRPQ